MGSAPPVHTASLSRFCRDATAFVCLALLVAALPAAAQEEGASDDEPEWIPSLGVGFGFYSREVTAAIEGVRTGTYTSAGVQRSINKGFLTGTQGPTFTESALGNPRDCTAGNSARPRAGICGPFEAVGKSGLEGGATSFHGQLLGPRWRTAPLTPRPFVQGMFALPINDRDIARDGFKPVDFGTIGSEPGVRIEMSAEPQNFWMVGGGVAFRIPWERYTLRAKLGLSYAQEEINLTAKVFNKIASQTGQNFDIGEAQEKSSVTIQSLTPSFGLEADLARFGPVMLSVSADTFFSVALSGTTLGSFERDANGNLNRDEAGFNFPSAPSNGVGTGLYVGSFKADDLQIFGTIGLRFAWVGFGR